jgi:hypothetical protein
MTTTADADTAAVAPSSSGRRRATCPDCTRPATVCLCAAFPAAPLRLRGACVVLQHPAEARQKFATAPLLRRALDARDFALERGRRFDAERSAPRLHALLRRAAASGAPVLVLWPRAGVSVGLASALAGAAAAAAERERERERGGGGGGGIVGADPAAADDDGADAAAGQPPLAYLLVAIDGTWVQAQEMSGPLARWIVAERGAALVHLDGGGGAGGPAAGTSAAAAAAAAAADGGAGPAAGTSAAGAAAAAAEAAAAAAAAASAPLPVVLGDPALRWRTEPLAAGMSTCEAVARALEACEAHAAGPARGGGSGGGGGGAPAAAAARASSAAALRAALVRPLARMVEIQVRYDPAMRARTGLVENGGEGGGDDASDGRARRAPPDDAGAYVRASRRFRTARRARAGLPGVVDADDAGGAEAAAAASAAAAAAPMAGEQGRGGGGGGGGPAAGGLGGGALI